MRHKNKGRKLKRTSSHKKALMRSLASALFEHKKISTTVAKAKELRPYAEKIITKAKHAARNEKQGLLPEGQTIDIHNRRIVFKNIKSKAVIQELFDVIAPLVEERDGGYTRIIKTGHRRGDGSSLAIIELVDWSAPKDGASNLKSKKRHKQAKKVKDETVVTEEKSDNKIEKADVTDKLENEAEITEEKVEETIKISDENKETAPEENIENQQSTEDEKKEDETNKTEEK